MSIQVLELEKCAVQLEQCQLVRYNEKSGTMRKLFDEPKVRERVVCVCVDMESSKSNFIPMPQSSFLPLVHCVFICSWDYVPGYPCFSVLQTAKKSCMHVQAPGDEANQNLLSSYEWLQFALILSRLYTVHYMTDEKFYTLHVLWGSLDLLTIQKVNNYIILDFWCLMCGSLIF